MKNWCVDGHQQNLNPSFLCPNRTITPHICYRCAAAGWAFLQLTLGIGRYDHDVIGAVNIRRVVYNYWRNPGIIRHPHFAVVAVE
jgi:hypothetical protein